MTDLVSGSQLSRGSRIWLALLFLTALVGLIVVPWESSVPIHWALDGQADAFAPGWLAVLLPLSLGLALLAFLLFVRRLGAAQDIEASRHPYEVTIISSLAFSVFLEVMVVYTGRGGSLDVRRSLIVAAGLVMIVVGNSLPKARPTWQAGLPLSWTKNHPDLWRISQRWFARAHIASGLAILLMATVNLKGLTLIACILGAAIFPTALAALVAYRLGKNGRYGLTKDTRPV